MRTISLWQPWAELISRGLKQFETRSFPCEKFGEIAIHAAKKKFDSGKYSQELRTQMLMDEVDPYWLKYGVVLCIADIVACVQIDTGRNHVSQRELTYGDWSPGRYAWRLENIRPLPEPIPLKGMQGFFYWKEGKEICAEAFR